MLRVTLLRLHQAKYNNNQHIITRISVTLSFISFPNPIKVSSLPVPVSLFLFELYS